MRRNGDRRLRCFHAKGAARASAIATVIGRAGSVQFVATASRQTRVRHFVDLAVLIALVAGFGIWSAIWGWASSGAPPPPTSAQIQRASSWLSALPLPADAQRDRTATACWPLTGSFCFTVAVGAEALLGELQTLLKAHGAAVGTANCNPPMKLPRGRSGFEGGLRCSIDASYRGVAIFVGVGDRFTLGPRPAAFGTVDLATNDSPVIHQRPLGTLTSLRVIPPNWHVSLPCVERVPAGCRQYKGQFSLSIPYRNAQLDWLRMLVTSRYDVDLESCARITRGPHRVQSCAFNAVRNFGPGPNNPLSVFAFLKRTGPRSTYVHTDITY